MTWWCGSVVVRFDAARCAAAGWCGVLRRAVRWCGVLRRAVAWCDVQYVACASSTSDARFDRIASSVASILSARRACCCCSHSATAPSSSSSVVRSCIVSRSLTEHAAQSNCSHAACFSTLIGGRPLNTTRRSSSIVAATSRVRSLPNHCACEALGRCGSVGEQRSPRAR